jgi:hypothetical protein
MRGKTPDPHRPQEQQILSAGGCIDFDEFAEWRRRSFVYFSDYSGRKLQRTTEEFGSFSETDRDVRA